MLAESWNKVGAMISAATRFPAMELWVKRIGAAVLGGAAGFAYYRFVGCVSGSCPITSNPWLTMLFGVIIGASFVSKKPPVT